MDPNHILFFLALFSPVIVIARSRGAASQYRGWRHASVAVLMVTALAWIFFRRTAGYIGGGACLVLLVLPAVGMQKIVVVALQERYAAARRLARLLAILHPGDGIPEQALLCRALQLAQRGRTHSALESLSASRVSSGATRHRAAAQIFRILEDWSGLLAWCRAQQMVALLRDPVIMALYFRALGETQAINDFVLQFAARIQVASANSAANSASQMTLLTLLSFCGRTASVVRQVKKSGSKMSRERRRFWLATSQLAAGEIAAGRAELEALRIRTKDALLRADIEVRLLSADDYAAAATKLSLESERILRRLENRPVSASPYFSSQRLRGSPVVFALIAANVIMFAIETLVGGSENPLVLHRLGQLETYSFFADHQYWRLLTALFLHYGYLHLIFNLYALFILGPALEQSLGTLRFFICYILSGIGAGLGVIVLYALGLTQPQDVVGASGSIMGIVGAWAGLLLRNRHAYMAGRRLQSIVIIVGIQTAFDLLTPQVSMASHLSGLACGLFLGLLLAPSRLRA